MATKKAAKTAKSASRKPKKFFAPGGDPIIIGGGGGGRPKKRIPAPGSFLLIGFNRAYYKDKPKPKKWAHNGASLNKLLIYVGGLPLLQQPTVKPNSTVILRCLCGSTQSDIIITGKDLGIEIPAHCTDMGDSFICDGCSITNVVVDGKNVFTSLPGQNVGLKVLNS